MLPVHLSTAINCDTAIGSTAPLLKSVASGAPVTIFCLIRAIAPRNLTFMETVLKTLKRVDHRNTRRQQIGHQQRQARDLQIVGQRCARHIVNIYDIGIMPYFGYRDRTSVKVDSDQVIACAA